MIISKKEEIIFQISNKIFFQIFNHYFLIFQIWSHIHLISPYKKKDQKNSFYALKFILDVLEEKKCKNIFKKLQNNDKYYLIYFFNYNLLVCNKKSIHKSSNKSVFLNHFIQLVLKFKNIFFSCL